MAYLLILSLLSLCVIWCPATAYQGDGGVGKMEDRLSTMERKLNQYMEEHNRLLQQNQDLQRRVSKTEKKNGELTTKISSLEEKVNEIQQSNDKCQIDIKQLFEFFEKHFNSFILIQQKMDRLNTSNSNKVKSHSSHADIQKRIVPATVAPTEQVAFYAYLSTSTKADLPQHHTLIYDVVKVNKGQGYHQDDGIFIVPSSGVYVFVWAVAIENHGWASFELVVNGEVFGSAFADDNGNGGWDHGTGVAVVETHTGDHVYIRMYNTGEGVVYSGGQGRTSFSGWKLF